MCFFVPYATVLSGSARIGHVASLYPLDNHRRYITATQARGLALHAPSVCHCKSVLIVENWLARHKTNSMGNSELVGRKRNRGSAVGRRIEGSKCEVLLGAVDARMECWNQHNRKPGLNVTTTATWHEFLITIRIYILICLAIQYTYSSYKNKYEVILTVITYLHDY